MNDLQNSILDQQACTHEYRLFPHKEAWICEGCLTEVESDRWDDERAKRPGFRAICYHRQHCGATASNPCYRPFDLQEYEEEKRQEEEERQREREAPAQPMTARDVAESVLDGAKSFGSWLAAFIGIQLAIGVVCYLVYLFLTTPTMPN